MANSGEKVLYFLIGGFVGASVALLFAPKSGQETRELLGSKYREGTETIGRKLHEGRERLSRTGHSVAERVSSAVEQGRDTVQKQKEQISSAIEAGKKAYHEEKSKLEGPEYNL